MLILCALLISAPNGEWYVIGKNGNSICDERRESIRRRPFRNLCVINIAIIYLESGFLVRPVHARRVLEGQILC